MDGYLKYLPSTSNILYLFLYIFLNTAISVSVPASSGAVLMITKNVVVVFA